MSADNKAQTISLAIKFQAVHEVLVLLAKSKSDREAGRKALLLAFTIDKEIIGTQRELARLMGVTEGRASQMLKVFRRHFLNKSPVQLTALKI